MCSKKLDQSKYPQKFWNSKTEILKINNKLRICKAWRCFKTYINIDREKYVFLLLFAWKLITFGSLCEIRGHPQVYLVKTSGVFQLSVERGKGGEGV